MGDVFNAITGAGAQHNANQALSMQKQQQQQATGYRQQASGAFGDLYNQGLSQYNSWQPLVQSTLSGYANASGIGGLGGGSAAPSYSGAGYSGAQTPGSASQSSSAGPGGAPSYQAPLSLSSNPSQQSAAAQGGTSGGSPYSLLPYQQQQLNQGLDTINTQRETAIQNYRAQMAQHGITDPRALAATEAQIHAQYGGMANQHTTNFMEAARQAQQQAYQMLLGLATGQGNQAMSTQDAAAQGLLGTANSAQGGANSAGELSAQYQQMANQQINGLLGGVSQFANPLITPWALQQIYRNPNNVSSNSSLPSGGYASGKYGGGGFGNASPPAANFGNALPPTIGS